MLHLLNLIGYDGNNKLFAYEELIKTLNNEKANLYVFQHTFDEILEILTGCLEWINSLYYDPSKANPVLQHFVEQGFSRSDIEIKIQNFEKDLNKKGIKIYQLIPQPLIDEKDLMSLIISLYKERDPYFDEIGRDNTIYRDVKSISYIYQLRNGHKPMNIRDAKYIFLTTNTTLAYATRQFEIREFGTDIFLIPATLTDVFIGTLLWIQTPTSIETMNQKIISCGFAALQPSRPMLRRMVTEAKNLKENGQISEDDFDLLTQSSVARTMLQEKTLGELERFTGKTALEILNEIKNNAMLIEKRKYENERTEWENKITVEQRINEEQKEKIIILSTEKEKILTTIECNADSYAQKWSIAILIILIILAIILVTPNFFPSFFSTLPICLQRFVQVISGFMSILSFIYGVDALKIKEKVKNQFKQKYLKNFNRPQINSGI